jgi:hypothetical protein
VIATRPLAIAAAALVAAGCASQAGEARPVRPSVRPGEFGTPDCFVARLARDFVALDDRNLIVFAPGTSDAYHVQVSPSSGDLRFASTLAFESRNTQVCGHAGDRLMMADAGSRGQRLSVTGVYRLDERELDGLRARFGKAAPGETPAPAPGEGAAIERELGSPENE